MRQDKPRACTSRQYCRPGNQVNVDARRVRTTSGTEGLPVVRRVREHAFAPLNSGVALVRLFELEDAHE